MSNIAILGMLMIGAAGRNIGKTEFACSLIKKFAKRCDIVGIKVTSIDTAGGVCHHGHPTCRVCTSIEGSYEISEETDDQSGKDTCRMLAAGAKRVLWLRVLKSHLTDGLNALLEIVGPDAVMVCESNSLRNIVEPGVFIMAADVDCENYKPSAQAVKPYADRIISFNGGKFDIDLDDIKLIDGKWSCRLAAATIIMAGGQSVRMGHDKSMMLVNGKPMIEHIANQLRPYFSQMLISSNDVKKYGFLNVEVVPDDEVDQGPLRGIASSLKASDYEKNFVIACDIPQVNIAFIRQLIRQCEGCDAVVPKQGAAQVEPLFAVYNKSVIDIFEDALLSGQRKITDALRRCNVKYVELKDSQWLENINTEDDYTEFIKDSKDD